MRLEPITWELLTDRLAERLADDVAQRAGAADSAAQPRPWHRVAVDGAPPSRPGALAHGLADALRVRGLPAMAVDADGFLRAASLRFEFGRRDPDAYYDLWYDTGALRREVLAPLEPGGDGSVLPDLRAPSTDLPTRSPRVELPPGGVMLLHGPFLLGGPLPFELSVHLGLSAGALERLTAEDERWTLPAFARYEEEVTPQQTADVYVRTDKPGHPAWSGLPK